MAKFKLQLVQLDDGTPDAKAATVKALSRQLRITALTLLLATGMIIAVTVAWFANNREVKSNGMEMDVNVSSNLIIAVDNTDLASFQALSANEDTSHVTFSGAVQTLTPARHDSDKTSTYLGTISTNNGISSTSGLLAGGASPTLVAAANDANNQYYYDYVVRIAAAGEALAADGLYVSLSPSSADLLPEKPVDSEAEGYQTQLALYNQKMYRYATSVDFYVEAQTNTDYAADFTTVSNNTTYSHTLTPSSSNYKGTLNLADKNWSTSAALGLSESTTTATVDGKTVKRIQLSDGSYRPGLQLVSGAIACNNQTTNDQTCCYLVTMRFYFDGELLEDSAAQGANKVAYVHSDKLSPASFGVNVTFNAPAAS